VRLASARAGSRRDAGGRGGGPPVFRPVRPVGPKEKLVLALIAVLVAGSLAVLLLDVLLWPTLRTLTEAELQNLTVGLMYRAVSGEVSDLGSEYWRLFRVETDEHGRVTVIQPDTPAINDLAARATAAIQEAVEELEGVTVSIPLGRALGSRLLGGYGPKIHVKVYPLVVQDVRIWDVFESAGINQTRHRIYLRVVLRARTAIPFLYSEVALENDFPVAEAVIVGPVPSLWIGQGLLPGGVLQGAGG
jgi:sporulation protein YunB